MALPNLKMTQIGHVVSPLIFFHDFLYFEKKKIRAANYNFKTFYFDLK